MTGKSINQGKNEFKGWSLDTQNIISNCYTFAKSFHQLVTLYLSTHVNPAFVVEHVACTIQLL
jgi:hypothetical protein